MSSANIVKKFNRDLRFDNLRALAVVCVIVAHLIESLHFDPAFGFFRHCLFVFMIPLLFFISGYFSKDSPDGLMKAVKNILVPYIIFDFLWIVFDFLLTGSLPKYPFLISGWGLWFLVSLFFMRAFLPVLAKIKHIFWISVVVAVIVVLFENHPDFLSWYRTLYFLPMFLLGFYYPEIQDKFKPKLDFDIKNRTKIFVAIALIILIFVGGILRVIPLPNSPPFFSSASLFLVLIALITLVFRLITVILFFYLFKNSKSLLTKVGQNSLMVYILSFYFIFLLVHIIRHFAVLNTFITTNFVVSIVYITLATLIITYITSRDFVSENVNKLIFKVNDLIFK